jgi:hypothetical protein
VWDEIQTAGDKPVADQGPSNVFNKLTVSVGENIYFFGNTYTIDKENTVTYSSPHIHVFNVTSGNWRKIEAVNAIPAKKFADGYYGVAMGTDIWILHNATWYCFDTVKEDWRSVSISTPCLQGKTNSVAVIGYKIYFYNGHRGAIKRNIICLDTKDQIVTELPDAFGEHPEEQYESYLFTLDQDTLGLLASRSEHSKSGDVFYYDLKEHKWTRAKVSLTKLGKHALSYFKTDIPYAGQFDNVLYFLGEKSIGKRKVDAIWGREIGAENWIRIKVEGKTFPIPDRASSVAVNETTLYYFTREAKVYSLKKSFVNLPIDNISKKLVEQARKELQDIAKVLSLFRYIPMTILTLFSSHQPPRFMTSVTSLS